MKFRLILVWFQVWIWGLSCELQLSANPIMAGADPHVLVLGDTIWMYPTWSGGRGERFFAFSSTDLKSWQRHGPVLDFRDVAWIDDDGASVHHAWAPAVVTSNGKFFFYYSVGPQNPTPSRLGVAVGSMPEGPFRDSGKPLLTGGEGFEAIDPMVFVDPKTDKAYLYAGGSAGAKLRVFELNPDMLSLSREVPVQTPPQFTEGVFMHYHDGRYYLSYSHGGWRESSYSVHYATSESPTGPWTYRGPILSSDESRKGPGHHSFFRNPLNGEWLIAYHRWEDKSGAGPYRGSRQLCIDRAEYDAQGLLRPVAMTTKSASSLAVGTFSNPINRGPDPWMIYHEGNYYLTTTQGDCIRIWKATTLAGLKTTDAVTVWRDENPTRSHGIWAPEFHFISNRWYLYYTAMAATRVDTTHRMHVLESEGVDPLGPYHYKARLFDPENDFYAIDGSVFQHPGDKRWYFLWAAHPGHRIRIALMANPWTLEGASVQLEAAGFGCEEVREGPVILHRNGRLFLTYSACDTGKPDYKIGMLVADENADVMNPASWTQYPHPVFERNDAAGVFGPGHHGFFRSPDGTEDWIVYHGKTSSNYTYSGRSTRAQKFSWNADGTPNFGKPLAVGTVLAEPSKRDLKRSSAEPDARQGAFSIPKAVLRENEPFHFNSFVDCNMAEVWVGDIFRIFPGKYGEDPLWGNARDLKYSDGRTPDEAFRNPPSAFFEPQLPTNAPPGQPGLHGAVWFETVYQDARDSTGKTLYAVYHNENYPSTLPYSATTGEGYVDRDWPQGLRGPESPAAVCRVGVMKSKDGGKSWVDVGLFLEDKQPRLILKPHNDSQTFPGGVGDPSAVACGEFLYLFYGEYGYPGVYDAKTYDAAKEWSGQCISVARIRLEDLDAPQGKARRWDGSGFNAAWDGIGQPVASLRIPREAGGGPASSAKGGFHWGPSVSWNYYLKCWVMLMGKVTGPSWKGSTLHISYNPHADLSAGGNSQDWTPPQLLVDKPGHILWYPSLQPMNTPEDITNRNTCLKLGQRARLFFKYSDTGKYVSEYVVEFQK